MKSLVIIHNSWNRVYTLTLFFSPKHFLRLQLPLLVGITGYHFINAYNWLLGRWDFVSLWKIKVWILELSIFSSNVSYLMSFIQQVRKNSKKRATATQSVTCLVKRVKSSYSIFHDTLKCHYHDTFTYSFLGNTFYTPSHKVSIFIALLGVSASASPPFPSGLTLVFLSIKTM